MRILHVYKDFAPHRGGGGVARHIHGLSMLTAQAGHAVRVAAPRADMSAPSCRYAVVRADASALWSQIGWADIVHVHGARTPIAALGAALARARGKRVIYTPHCYYDDDVAFGKRLRKWWWDRLVERALLRGADRVVLLAAYWQDYLEQRGMQVTYPVLLPNAVLEAELPRPPIDTPPLTGSPALLSLGRLDVVKRLHDAIAALTEPGMQEAVLHLVGRGPDRARLEMVASTLGVAGRVRFHGFLSDADVATMAAAADVFVLPSAVEGMPTVLIEMLLLGCPVVASDIPGNRAILSEVGMHDALYPLGNVACLTDCIAAQRPRSLSAAEVAQTRTNFTWEGIRPQVLALYDAVAALEPVR